MFCENISEKQNATMQAANGRGVILWDFIHYTAQKRFQMKQKILIKTAKSVQENEKPYVD